MTRTLEAERGRGNGYDLPFLSLNRASCSLLKLTSLSFPYMCLRYRIDKGQIEGCSNVFSIFHCISFYVTKCELHDIVHLQWNSILSSGKQQLELDRKN